MFNYLKIGLLALLSMGSLLAMELPEPQPAVQSTVSVEQAGRQVFLTDGYSLLTIAEKDLLNAETVNHSMKESEHDYVLDISPELFTHLTTIKDYLAYDHDTPLEVLQKKLIAKDNLELTAISDAANYVHASKLLDAAITVMAKRFNHLGMQQKCLIQGSYNIPWINSNITNLIAQKMDELDPIMFEILLRAGSIKKGPSVIKVPGNKNWVRAVVAPDDTHIISGSNDGIPRVWNKDTHQCARMLPGGSGHLHFSACVTPNRKYIILGSLRFLEVWDAQTDACLHTLSEGRSGLIYSVCATPDSKLVISASFDGNVRIWDIEQGVCLRTLGGHTAAISSVCITPNGKHIISGSHDKTIRIWEIDTGYGVSILENFGSPVTSVCVTSDSEYIISGSDDKMIRIWEIKTGKCICTLSGHTDKVFSVCLTPDNKYIISGAWDKTIRVWYRETGKCVGVLSGHAAEIDSVCVTSNGEQIISGSRDQTIRIWELVDSLLFKEYKRALTPEMITALRYYCYAKKSDQYDYQAYPGLATIVKTFSQDLQEMLLLLNTKKECSII